MSNKLIKKAYEKLNGVYPHNSQWGHDAKYASRTVLAVCTESHKGYLDCEYEEGGLYVVDVSYDKGKWFFITKADFDAYGESLKAEQWAPEVDVKCLGNLLDHVTLTWSYVEVVPIRKLGDDWVVVVDGVGKLSYCDEFRPLKTESEKQANAMFDIVKDATDLYHACEILVNEGFKKCAG